MPSKTQPLVVQELDSFIRHSLRDATRGRTMKVSYGDAGTGSDVDDIAFSPVSRKVLLEITGDGETETGRVVAYSRHGHQIAVDAIRHFTDTFGAPATFQVLLSDEPPPGTHVKDGVTTLLR